MGCVHFLVRRHGWSDATWVDVVLLSVFVGEGRIRLVSAPVQRSC